MLNVDIGAPLLAFRRVSYCNEETLEYGETFIRPDFFEVVVTMEGHYAFLER